MNMPVVQTALTIYGAQSLNAAEMQLQVNLIQDILHKVMKQGTHYGVIPGTQSQSLYKPGAEKIMATFRLAADPVVEDLSQGGEVHYRVKLRVLNSSGDYLGAGVGECSSMEDKYAWRSPACDAEYESMPDILRRLKFKRGNNNPIKQVRTQPADVANTILKMAKKRALVDAVLTVTAASDIFTQDIEDLPEELVAELVGKPIKDDTPTVEKWNKKFDDCKTIDALNKCGAEFASEKIGSTGKALCRASYTARLNTLKKEVAEAEAKAITEKVVVDEDYSPAFPELEKTA